MSRIAKLPVKLPQGVNATIAAGAVTVKGAKGTMTLPLAPGVTVAQKEQALVVSVTIVSFILSALLVPAAPRFGVEMARLLGESPPPAGKEASEKTLPEVVIVGFGPTGQIAARLGRDDAE